MFPVCPVRMLFSVIHRMHLGCCDKVKILEKVGVAGHSFKKATKFFSKQELWGRAASVELFYLGPSCWSCPAMFQNFHVAGSIST